MTTAYKVLTPHDLGAVADPTREFGLEVLHGLSESPKNLPSKFFYDEYGSRLFERITELEDYYPTRCEREILEREGGRITALTQGRPFNLIELGSGDGHKTRLLIRRLVSERQDFRYVPIDISESTIERLTRNLAVEFPSMAIEGVVSDYFDGIRWIRGMDQRRNLVLFLGSNIGNFHRAKATAFLRTLWDALSNQDLVLIGFDLKKSIATMTQAYNDREGVTREFNLNLLRRINRELGGDFDLSKFAHYSAYDVFSGAMESYLVSLERQTVFIAAIGQTFEFEPFEPIHTEYSYKYLESDIDQLAAATGFVPVLKLFDPARWFTDCIWRVEKTPPPR